MTDQLVVNKGYQKQLNNLGYGPLIIDGILGPNSIRAIKRFQLDKSLLVDGVIGPKTLLALNNRPPPEIGIKEPFERMRFSSQGFKMLMLSEAVRRKAYLDTKRVITIGIGATWGSKLFQEWWIKNKPGQAFDLQAVVTIEEINDFTQLMIDEEYGKAVNSLLVKPIPQHAFDAAVHFVWNVGVGSIHWRWAIPFKIGDYCSASEIILTYLKPPELKSRREHEARLMCEGIYRSR